MSTRVPPGFIPMTPPPPPTPFGTAVKNPGKGRKREVCWYCVQSEIIDTDCEQELKNLYIHDSFPERFYQRHEKDDPCRQEITYEEKKRCKQRFSSAKHKYKTKLFELSKELEGIFGDLWNPSESSEINDGGMSSSGPLIDKVGLSDGTTVEVGVVNMTSPTTNNENTLNPQHHMQQNTGSGQIGAYEELQIAVASLKLEAREKVIRAVVDENLRQVLLCVLRENPMCSKPPNSFIEKVNELEMEVKRLNSETPNNSLLQKINEDVSILSMLVHTTMVGMPTTPTRGSINYNYLCLLKLPKAMYSRENIMLIAAKLIAEARAGYNTIKPKMSSANVEIDGIKFGDHEFKDCCLKFVISLHCTKIDGIHADLDNKKHCAVVNSLDMETAMENWKQGAIAKHLRQLEQDIHTARLPFNDETLEDSDGVSVVSEEEGYEKGQAEDGCTILNDDTELLSNNMSQFASIMPLRGKLKGQQVTVPQKLYFDLKLDSLRVINKNSQRAIIEVIQSAHLKLNLTNEAHFLHCWLGDAQDTFPAGYGIIRITKRKHYNALLYLSHILEKIEEIEGDLNVYIANELGTGCLGVREIYEQRATRNGVKKWLASTGKGGKKYFASPEELHVAKFDYMLGAHSLQELAKKKTEAVYTVTLRAGKFLTDRKTKVLVTAILTPFPTLKEDIKAKMDCNTPYRSPNIPRETNGGRDRSENSKNRILPEKNRILPSLPQRKHVPVCWNCLDKFVVEIEKKEPEIQSSIRKLFVRGRLPEKFYGHTCCRAPRNGHIRHAWHIARSRFNGPFDDTVLFQSVIEERAVDFFNRGNNTKENGIVPSCSSDISTNAKGSSLTDTQVKLFTSAYHSWGLPVRCEFFDLFEAFNEVEGMPTKEAKVKLLKFLENLKSKEERQRIQELFETTPHYKQHGKLV
eukprot:m.126662 g.126662  ORF g.126662 m.126662 type:complete len:917 (+) comp14521_c0_seq1:233-2983(+)